MLNSDLIWKLQGTVTGTTAISYPSQWNEAYISVTYTGATNNVYEYTFHILKKDVETLGSSNYKFYKHGIGGGNTGTFGEICILASTGTFITLNTLVASSDFLNSATITMYYR